MIKHFCIIDFSYNSIFYQQSIHLLSLRNFKTVFYHLGPYLKQEQFFLLEMWIRPNTFNCYFFLYQIPSQFCYPALEIYIYPKLSRPSVVPWVRNFNLWLMKSIKRLGGNAHLIDIISWVCALGNLGPIRGKKPKRTQQQQFKLNKCVGFKITLTSEFDIQFRE